MPGVRVLRVYHAGRDPAHRERERNLVRAGVQLTLVVPRFWPDGGSQRNLTDEAFRIVELAVKRPGDVNRHAYADESAIRRLLRDVAPDILDVHEEPFSLAGRQWLKAAPVETPVVMYTAQNVDKRLPPPFYRYEQRSHRRAGGLYPCSRQAAAVARGKGFDGLIDVIPLGYDPTIFFAGSQSPADEVATLALVGRLVPEKGVRDAVRVLVQLNATRSARLVLAGSGPEEQPARELAGELGVADRLEVVPWQSTTALADLYRNAHVVLVPSIPTATWTEQFGRVIVEAQASGAVVAGYATGSIPDVAGKSAMLVRAGDADALAVATRALLEDASGYAERRQRGLWLSSERTWAEVAARQVDLYRAVVAGGQAQRDLPLSGRARRVAARAEFGSTAPTIAGVRPFAVPFLRRGGTVPKVLGAAIDAGAELKARRALISERPEHCRRRRGGG